MRAAIFKISGTPAKGDLIMLSARAPKGGASNAKYTARGEEVSAELVNGEAVKKVVLAEEPNEIAQALARAFNSSEFCSGQFAPRVAGDTLIVTLSDAVHDVRFVSEIYGTGSVKIEEVLE